MSAQPGQPKISSQSSGTVLPAVPVLPIGQRVPTPTSRLKDNPADDGKNEIASGSPAVNQHQESVTAVGKEGEITSGSHKLKSGAFAPISDKTESETGKRAVRPSPDHTDAESTPEDAMSSSNDKTEPRPAPTRPMKIEIPSAATGASALKDLPDVKNMSPAIASAGIHTPPVITSAVVQTPPTMSSRPSTPATTTSEISRASVPRPRTIRVTTNVTRTGSDTGPVSAITEKSLPTPSLVQSQLKREPQRSRAPSVTSAVSQSRPSTPAMSDRFSMTNDMLSRANSPPPSIVGSAPERTKSKAQTKRERKENAKRTTEVSEGGTSHPPATPPMVGEVAPVLGRQRKVKRHREGTGTDSAKDSKAKGKSAKSEDIKVADEAVTDSGETSQDVAIGESSAVPSERNKPSDISQLPETRGEKSEVRSANVGISTEKEEPDLGRREETKSPKDPYTLLDLYTESAKHKHDPLKLQKLLSEHVSSLNKLLDAMLESKELDPTSALFSTQQSLHSSAFKLPPDSRRGAEYLDANGYTDSNPFGQIYLGPKEKKALWNGESFGVADEREGRQGDLLRRALVTGGGVVYRHLTREQEDRVMELEARKEHYAAQWGEIGIMDKLGRLEADDYINIEGGVEALVRHGDKHGIGWVMGQQRDEWDDDADADDEDADQFDDDFEDEDDRTQDLDPSTLRWEAAAATGVNPRALTGLNSKTAGAPKLPTASLPVNLRAMDNAQLQKRAVDSQREMDVAKKELEKMEKLMLKKAKEVAKWREGFAALKV